MKMLPVAIKSWLYVQISIEVLPFVSLINTGYMLIEPQHVISNNVVLWQV